MAYKVIKAFTDKDTGKSYEIGDTIETLDSVRFEVLFHKQNDYNERFISIDVDEEMTKAELFDIAEYHGIEVGKKATKAEIIKALEG
ncbi:hypothetical protein [Staphylococcus agnetis]|uniref:hypothetical protein n=1 Tax=Staphylococcus agnetis TaxID=985762 RepID=UPI0021CFAAFE|nr:hypothetical protein [Staphylococcus agnetis]UXU58999.1 hypothetical protein MUA97_08900 [Staphylococcus agnetis]UXU61324.1 hypothetical protein MUA43_08900 [Staphylococcus agnetis]